MSSNPYDYSTRVGVRPISWNDFHAICKGLAVAAAPFDPEISLAVGRGGFYPGTLISHILQAEVYAVRLTRRVKDVPKYKRPRWLVRPPRFVQGKRVLIVDEICGAGQTLSMVRREVERHRATKVRTAVLYAHTWGTSVPDYIGIISDELILNPWDREILVDGTFQFHPEYAEALAQQGLPATSALLIDAPPLTPAKQPQSPPKA